MECHQLIPCCLLFYICGSWGSFDSYLYHDELEPVYRAARYRERSTNTSREATGGFWNLGKPSIAVLRMWWGCNITYREGYVDTEGQQGLTQIPSRQSASHFVWELVPRTLSLLSAPQSISIFYYVSDVGVLSYRQCWFGDKIQIRTEKKHCYVFHVGHTPWSYLTTNSYLPCQLLEIFFLNSPLE